jgi:integrase/recombinase XerD
MSDESTASIALGRRMMTSAKQETGWSERRRAVHYRDGLIIALRAYRPLRLKNFASIVLGVHVVQQGGGWWLKFPTSRMKAKRPYEVAFPAALVPELEHYLAIHRTTFLATPSP